MNGESSPRLGIKIDRYASGQSQSDIEGRLLDKVQLISQARILQRMRPSWLEPSGYILNRNRPHNPNRLKPLWKTLDAALNQFQAPLNELLPGILDQARELVSSLKSLDDEEEDADARNTLLRSIVKQCADISCYNEKGTLEAQIAGIPEISDLASRRAVNDIDKIARYYGLCEDISRIAVKSRYCHLFERISLQHLEAPPQLSRRGSTTSCYVHAEVQLILHYERYPPDGLWPRVIGGSKCACFMCDLFIQKVAKYQISYSHCRLYTQWTIPDAPWMASEQADSFQYIVVSMTDELRSLEATARREISRGNRTYSGNYARESRTVVLLGSELSTTELSNPESSRAITPVREIEEVPASSPESGTVTPVPGLRETSYTTRSASPRSSLVTSGSSVSSLHLSTSDLPYEELICPEIPRLHLSLGQLSILIELASTTSRKLSVKEVNAHKVSDATRVDVMDLPTEDGMDLPPPQATSDFKVRLYNDSGFEIEIKVSSVF